MSNEAYMDRSAPAHRPRSTKRQTRGVTTQAVVKLIKTRAFGAGEEANTSPGTCLLQLRRLGESVHHSQSTWYVEFRQKETKDSLDPLVWSFFCRCKQLASRDSFCCNVHDRGCWE